MDTCSAPNRLTGSIVAVAVARHLEGRLDQDGDLGLVVVERDRRDPTDLDTAEHDGRARVEALSGAGERPAQRVVAGEVAVGQADERDRPEHQPEQDDQADDDAEEPLHPTNLAVALTPPKRISDMKRFTTTTRMMERRMARPAATPTPAGPPVAL